MPLTSFWNSISDSVSDSKLSRWAGRAAKVIKPKLEPTSLMTSTAVAVLSAIATMREVSPTVINATVILTSINHLFYSSAQYIEMAELNQKIKKLAESEPQVTAPYMPNKYSAWFFKLTQLATLVAGAIVPTIIASEDIDDEHKSILIMQIVSLLVATLAGYGENKWLHGLEREGSLAVKKHRMQDSNFAIAVSATLASPSYPTWKNLGYDFESLVLLSQAELAVMRSPQILILVAEGILKPDMALQKLQSPIKRNVFEHDFIRDLTRDNTNIDLNLLVLDVANLFDADITPNNLDDEHIQALLQGSNGISLVVAIQLEECHLAALNDQAVFDAIGSGQLTGDRLLATASNDMEALKASCQQHSQHRP